ncbi:MAG: hypothetical protein LBJ91_04480 [Clostridiales Family XIII bacterium]|jgi:hypothetical protein|nr:hypothetical protein [Clostridiales Family XIII bacterium]
MALSGRIEDHGGDALSMFQSACAAYTEDHDQVSFDFIKEMLADARQINGNAQQYGATSAVQSKAILMWWDEHKPTGINL